MSRISCDGPVPASRQGEAESPGFVHGWALSPCMYGFPYTPFEPSRFPIYDGNSGHGIEFVTFFHHMLVYSTVLETSVLLHASFQGLLGFPNIAVTASLCTTLYLIYNVTFSVFCYPVLGMHKSTPKGVGRLEGDRYPLTPKKQKEFTKPTCGMNH